MKDVSIIIITQKRMTYLRQLLNQVLDQCKKGELIVVVNNDPSDYHALKKDFPGIWIEGSFKTPGLARNEGLKYATKEWILFLDDDTEIPSDFFNKSFYALEKLSNEVVTIGGPDSSPPSSSIFARALNLALASPMATAHTRLRHTSETQNVLNGDESNLILCNLWVRANFIKEKGITFNEHLFRNEENLFITNILTHGGQVEYHPQLFIYHHRKTRLDLLAKAVFSSGKHRIKSSLFSRQLFSPLFLVPAGFIIYLSLLPFFYDIRNGLIPLKIYFTLSLILSLKITQGPLWPLVFFYQVFLNIWYGLGVIWGILLLPFWFWRLR